MRGVVAFLDAGKTCPADGEMLWGKSTDDVDHYSLCYAPTMKAGNPGPSGGMLQCDENSYFMVEAPQFCCKNPRIEMGGKRIETKAEVCGDLLAEFNQGSQKLRLKRGPTSTGSSDQMAELDANSLGDDMPSPIAYWQAQQGNDWRPLNGARCRGRSGTMIAWTQSNPPGRAEMCPTGTPPVRGQGYASWACDGSYTKEKVYHCCKVKGRLHCVRNFSEQPEGVGACHCLGIGGLKQNDEEPAAASALPLFFPALATSLLPNVQTADAASAAAREHLLPRRRQQSGRLGGSFL